MSIIKNYQKENNLVKDTYNILIDLESICNINYLNDERIVFHPCRLKAVNSLYDKGHIINIFTRIDSSKRENIIQQLEDLKYHNIIFDFINVDFIVSSKSREQISFFDELFDRDYEIKPLQHLISYDVF